MTPAGIKTIRRPRSVRGFSLMELMIVMFIIVLMAGLLLVAGNKVQTSAKVNQTRVTLSVCKAALDEYELNNKGKRLPHLGAGDGIAYVPIDWATPKVRNAPDASGSAVITDDDGLFYASIERFVWAMLRNPTTEKMVKSIDARSYRDYDENGFLEVTDAFGGSNRKKLLYLSYVDHDDNYTEDDILPERDKPYFASAGPDGLWGDWREYRKREEGDSHNADLATEAEDNLYSFELD